MTVPHCITPLAVGISGQDARTRAAIASILRHHGYLVEEFEDVCVVNGVPAPAKSTAEEREALAQFLKSAAAHETATNTTVALLSISIQHDPISSIAMSNGEDRSATYEKSLLEELTRLAIEPVPGSPDAQPSYEFKIARIDRARFGIALANLTKPADAVALATRIQERFVSSLSILGREMRVQSSIGIAATAAENFTNADILFEQAEIASFCVSHQSDRRPQLFTEAMARWSAQRQQLEHDLQEAIRSNQFIVYYQPRVETRTRRVIGMEALVRWNHPTLGLVAPGQFIPIAEESGLITNIGEIVLQQACAQAKAWRDEGLPPVRMGVNVSGLQFRNPAFYNTVIRILQETQATADSLELELTESVLMEDPKQAILNLEKFKKAGIHLSIDDFGTGYSSLAYLKRFPVDALKIDQSFIRQVTMSPRDAAITTAVIVLGHSLHLNVIAEGVETRNQLDFLEVLKCDEIQGFLFGRPEPAEKAREVLASGIATFRM